MPAACSSRAAITCGFSSCGRSSSTQLIAHVQRRRAGNFVSISCCTPDIPCATMNKLKTASSMLRPPKHTEHKDEGSGQSSCRYLASAKGSTQQTPRTEGAQGLPALTSCSVCFYVSHSRKERPRKTAPLKDCPSENLLLLPTLRQDSSRESQVFRMRIQRAHNTPIDQRKTASVEKTWQQKEKSKDSTAGMCKPETRRHFLL